MNITRLSKFLSLVLRHRPEAAHVHMDEAGWVSVPDLLKGAQITLLELQQVVAENNKQRFEFNEGQTMIRARQGHSIPVSLGYEPKEPPEFLYHGTGQQNVHSIKQQGILKMQRHAVHMSPDEETARKVGSRHGVPTVLVIKALEMHKAGHKFHLTDNGVWFTETVPASFIR